MRLAILVIYWIPLNPLPNILGIVPLIFPFSFNFSTMFNIKAEESFLYEMSLFKVPHLKRV